MCFLNLKSRGFGVFVKTINANCKIYSPCGIGGGPGRTFSLARVGPRPPWHSNSHSHALVTVNFYCDYKSRRHFSRPPGILFCVIVIIYLLGLHTWTVARSAGACGLQISPRSSEENPRARLGGRHTRQTAEGPCRVPCPSPAFEEDLPRSAPSPSPRSGLLAHGRPLAWKPRAEHGRARWLQWRGTVIRREQF